MALVGIGVILNRLRRINYYYWLVF
ncbi:Protein of unknown function [Bacillus cereus]|nr:Protein of unknown function [Bacillus cereus]